MTPKLLLVIGLFALSAAGQEMPHSILREKGSSVRLRLFDASSRQPITLAQIELSRITTGAEGSSRLVVSMQKSANDGSVAISQDLLKPDIIVGAPGYDARELGMAEWRDLMAGHGISDKITLAWILELIPKATIQCHRQGANVIVLVAKDWGSAEVRSASGSPEIFGLLHCQQSQKAYRSCSSNVSDTGFGATFNRDGEHISVQLQERALERMPITVQMACEPISRMHK